LADATVCAITSYEILKSDNSAVISSDALYTYLNMATRSTAEVQVNTELAAQNGLVTSIPQNFVIKAIASGGAFITKTVETNLVVCSSETIALATAGKQTYSITKDAAAE
jgi:hypothetical protein